MSSSGDTGTFYIVCDISGSMSENGKRMQVRSAARTIEQYIRLGYGSGTLKLVLWNETASLTEWDPDDDFPEELFDCRGPANAEALCTFFDPAPEGKIILLTDGCWSGDAAAVLKRWLRKLSPETLRIIKIGGETGLRLKQENVFAPDEILPLLDGWAPLHDPAGKNGEADEW